MRNIRTFSFLLALVLALSTVLFSASCEYTGIAITVDINIYIPDSEDGFSGTVYKNSAYEYSGTATVDGILKSLAEENAIVYENDGEFVTINGYSFFDMYDFSYSRAWTPVVNGTESELGFDAPVCDGDKVTVIYKTYIHE